MKQGQLHDLNARRRLSGAPLERASFLSPTEPHRSALQALCLPRRPGYTAAWNESLWSYRSMRCRDYTGATNGYALAMVRTDAAFGAFSAPQMAIDRMLAMPAEKPVALKADLLRQWAGPSPRGALFQNPEDPEDTAFRGVLLETPIHRGLLAMLLATLPPDVEARHKGNVRIERGETAQSLLRMSTYDQHWIGLLMPVMGDDVPTAPRL